MLVDESFWNGMRMLDQPSVAVTTHRSVKGHRIPGLASFSRHAVSAVELALLRKGVPQSRFGHNDYIVVNCG